MSEQANPRSGLKSGPAEEVVPDCPHCLKPLPLDICEAIKPIDSRIELLILQHPQEQDRALGTARLTPIRLKAAIPKVRAVLAEPCQGPGARRSTIRPLGGALSRLDQAADLDPERARSWCSAARVTRRNSGESAQHRGGGAVGREVEPGEGLWWRNPWVLKCQRVILGPPTVALWQTAPEPRRDGLSTLEAAGFVLAGLEGRHDIAETLNASFDRMLARYREVQAEMPELAPKPKKRDYRRRKRS